MPLTVCPQAAKIAQSTFLPAAKPNSLGSCRPFFLFKKHVQLKTASSPSQRCSSVVQALFNKAKSSTKTAYICLDCGYIYDDSESFESVPSSYRCPVCRAPKRRFKVYEEPVGRNPNDLKIRKARKSKIQGGTSDTATTDKGDNSLLVYGGVGGAVLLALLYFVLNSLY